MSPRSTPAPVPNGSPPATSTTNPTGVVLRDGNRASVGDWVVTRTNHEVPDLEPRPRLGQERRHLDHHRPPPRRRADRPPPRPPRHACGCPPTYVADSLELAYASTAHRVQGTTVDTAHALVTPEMTREALYVASTRGRTSTHWYATTEHLLDATSHHEPEPPTTARDLLAGVLARAGGEDSATGTIRTTRQEALSLPTLVARYQHAWNHAALDALRTTADTALTPDQASRLLTDPGAGHLARVLADATSRGANPTQVLTNAIDYDTLTGVRSTALILASRIQDYPTTLGIPRTEPADRPLPWLPAPNTGHPAWNDYLRQRAQLITDRANQLGPLSRGLPRAVPAHPPTTRRPRHTHQPADGQQRTAYHAVLRSRRGDEPTPTQAPTDQPAAPHTSRSRATTERPCQINDSANAHAIIEAMGHTACPLGGNKSAPERRVRLRLSRVNGLRHA